MKFDMNTVIMDINDERPLRVDGGTDAEGKPLPTKEATVRAIIQTSLGTPIAGDDKLSNDEKLKIYRLGKRCKAEEASFTASDVHLILDRISKYYGSAYIYGFMKEFMDPPVEEQPVKANGADAGAAAH